MTDSGSEIFTAPWYPWYVNDVLTSERVELMSLAEEGAYRRALDRAWKKGSIPADPMQCAKAIGKRCPVKVAEVVLRMFHPLPNDPSRMVHDTLEKVREEQRQKYLRQSNKGKAGAEKRWQENSTGIAQAMPKQWQSESDTETDTKRKEKKKKAPAPQQSDEEWLKSLSENPAYRNLSVLIEFEKAKVWADTNSRQCTRKFFVAWLNRAKPMEVPMNGRKPDVGRPQPVEQNYQCDKCFDLGEVSRPVPGSMHSLEWVPCECRMEKAA